MRRALLVLVSLLALPSYAFATWSVIAVDRPSGRVVRASVTCFDPPLRSPVVVPSLVLPGTVNEHNVGWWERAFAIVLVGWVGVAAFLLERRLIALASESGGR